MSTKISYEKSMRERAIAEKKFLVTVSVYGKHLKDDSCTVQAVADLATAQRITKIAVELLKKREKANG